MADPGSDHRSGTAMQAPLGGIRVLDFTSVVFGPYASQILADYGAEVIKVEPPAGDPMRSVGPAAEPGLGAMFLGFNRNKRSLAVDLTRPDLAAAVATLAAGADVVMHSMRPGKMARLGLDHPSLSARNPGLVYAALHGFGEDGAYAGRPAYDDVIQGLSGAADLVRRQTGQVRYLPTIAADKIAGQAAAHAILAALLQRQRTGAGQYVEIPMFEVMTSFVLAEHLHRRHLRSNPETPAGYDRALDPWRRPYRTTNGEVCVMPYTDAHWQRLFRGLGRPDLADDPRFADLAARSRNIAALYRILGEIMATESTGHWLDLCARLDIPAAAANRLEDLENDPHLRQVGLFVDLTDGDRRYRFVRNPIRLRGAQVPVGMPPRLGADTVPLLTEAGLDGAVINGLVASGAAVDGRSADQV